MRIADTASGGIHYVLASTAGDAVNFSGVINGTATGNFLWTVPPGLLDAGQSYNWYVTDQSGNQLQDPQSFTVATDTFGSLSSLTSELWLYIGAAGSAGGNGSTGYGDCRETYGSPGAGGAASLALSRELGASTALDNVVLIAAGGGGGGQGRAEYEGYNGNPGDDGGSAISTASAAASASGEGRASASGNGSGACGVNPLATSCGTDGIGGRGGGEGSGVTGWVGTSTTWTQGEGGKSQGGGDDGGAGGGYGGGEAGGSGTGSSEGGGAGGSYAAQATLDDSGAPVLGPDGSPGSGNGVVVISFDVCSTYPTLVVCQP